ncbi:hypothetical protein O9929_21395 [Vibrio lentus]|nr:hypothetical protein [Vibrio lentus]
MNVTITLFWNTNRKCHAEISIRPPESVGCRKFSEVISGVDGGESGTDIVSTPARQVLLILHLNSRVLRYLYLLRRAIAMDGNNTLSLKVWIYAKKRPSERVNTMSITVTDSKFLESISFEPENCDRG